MVVNVVTFLDNGYIGLKTLLKTLFGLEKFRVSGVRALGLQAKARNKTHGEARN